MRPCPAPIQQVDRTYVWQDGRRLSYFAGCDYFRLSSHPKVIRAARRALAGLGLSVSASRRTTGNHRLFEELEKDLAAFFGVECAVIVSSGYAANLAAAQALASMATGSGPVAVLIDEHAHRSMWDAARVLKCRVHAFAHRNAADLARLARSANTSGACVVCTDGMFAHNGALAPLREYLKVLPANAVVLVDDAHAAGVRGAHGRGTAECEHIADRRLIQTITLSKAFGAYGGAVLGSRHFVGGVLRESAIFAGSTPIPLPLAAAAQEAIRLLRTDARPRLRLRRNIAFLEQQLAGSDLARVDPENPIFAFAAKRMSDVRHVEAELARREVHSPYIRYGTVGGGGYFRFVVSSEHTRAQLTNLGRALQRSAPRLKAMVS